MAWRGVMNPFTEKEVMLQFLFSVASAPAAPPALHTSSSTIRFVMRDSVVGILCT